MSRVDRPSLTVLLSAALVVGACTAAAPGPTDGGPSPAAEPAPVITPTAAASPTQAATPTAAATPTTAPTAPPTPAAPAATAPAASPAGSMLEVASSMEHGDYLAVDGRALYIFTPDPQGSSTCYDTCADNWPPLLAPMVAGEGVGGMLAEFERDNGEGRQVTYDGAPLYFFLADTAAGQTNGEGVGDVWFLARPAPAPGGGSDGSDDGDYDYEY
jgi:predicted lipoprotein with Yx(FWY)xxD motif